MPTSDPRAVFRPPERSCGTCDKWMRELISENYSLPASADSGVVELPCTALDGPPSATARTNYDLGWRRASDSCMKWTKRCAS